MSSKASVERKASPVTLRRRTLLEWLGAAAVLPLGAELLSACADSTAGRSADDAAGRDGGLAGDGRSPAETRPTADRTVSDAGFPFQPGPGTGHPVFDDWPIRTVDSQDLTAILAGWKLTVDGMVHTPRSYSFVDLAALPRQDQVTDFHCVEGWSVYDVPWNGVRLATLLEAAEVRGSATHVTFHTVGSKYNESVPLPVALEHRTLLAYGVAGATLPRDNGFPLRLVIPRLLGYKNAKFIDRIELTDRPIEGFWVAAGYDYAGEVPAQRLRPGKY